MPGYGLKLEGARELARSLRRVDADLARALNRGFREAGNLVADEARTLIRDQHLVASGEALRSVKVSINSLQGVVRETANRDGFPYPAIRRFKSLVLEPALAARLPEVATKLEESLDLLLTEEGLTE